MPVLRALSSSLWNTLINLTQFLQPVCRGWLLFTSKNTVQQFQSLKLQKGVLHYLSWHNGLHATNKRHIVLTGF